MQTKMEVISAVPAPNGAQLQEVKKKMKEILKHEVCPSCGSNDIKEIKPQWGICFNCEDNFHMIPLDDEVDDDDDEKNDVII